MRFFLFTASFLIIAERYLIIKSVYDKYRQLDDILVIRVKNKKMYITELIFVVVLVDFDFWSLSCTVKAKGWFC